MLMIASVTLMIIANTFSENENMDQTESIAAEPCQQHACLDELSEIRNDNEHQCHILDDNHADSIYESSSDDYSENNLFDGLAKWASDFQIKQNALDSLLKLLKQIGHHNLPCSARTLLNTARDIPVQQKFGMQYIYFPLATQLLKYLKGYPTNKILATESIEISLNIDGLPLFKSSQSSLGPVLCSIMNIQPVTVFPVVLTYGVSKPNDLEFLHELIRDLGNLLQNELQYNQTVVSVKLRCIVCDAPAKAFVKASKMYSGYFGCDKCSQKGMWNGRMVFPEVESIVQRTDQSFREQENPDHHKGIGPFCRLPIDMVKQFPVDYMHQVCLVL